MTFEYERIRMASAATGRAAVEALPATIRIGAFDFQIEKWTALQGQATQRWGEMSSIEQTVRIQVDMPSKHKAVDILLHEVMHALFWCYGIKDEDKEERIVGALGTAQMALYRDNPWLLKWIAESLS